MSPEVACVDIDGPLGAHNQWLTDIEAGTEGLPGEAGYGLMAWLVRRSQWRQWLGLPRDS